MMPKTDSHTIAIAGAGIGGLAAAALLAADGHEVTVHDQFEAPAPVGSGLVIQPVGLAVLEACGAAEAALAMGARITRMEGVEVDGGRRVLDVSYLRRGAGFGLAIHRAALFEALLDAAVRAGARLQARSRVVGTVPQGAGRALELEQGRTASAALVIDACGARSPLSPLTARPLPFGAIWATVPWPEASALPPDRLTQRYEKARRMAGVLPVGRVGDDPRPRAAIFWSLRRDDLEAWPKGDFHDWRREAEAFWPDFAPFLAGASAPQDFTKAAYTHGALKTPYAPALAHIGDAAHRASPQLGQGANMALLDALALAEAIRRHPLEAALPHYALTRRWHLWLYQLLSAAFTPQYQSESAWLPVLRDRVLMPISRLPPVPAILTRLVSGDLLPPIRGRGPFL